MKQKRDGSAEDREQRSVPWFQRLLNAFRHPLGAVPHAYSAGGGCFSFDCRVCGRPPSEHRRQPQGERTEPSAPET